MQQSYDPKGAMLGLLKGIHENTLEDYEVRIEEVQLPSSNSNISSGLRELIKKKVRWDQSPAAPIPLSRSKCPVSKSYAVK
jgi:hypothetical protein